jgi:BirA family biotin operon repressor/biotin-[acetyl-CoA-carboxylase] ligase
MATHAAILQWPAEAIWEEVFAVLPDFSVEVLPEVDSTNTELMRRARAGRAEPVLLVAERQTAGRGRLGRDWHSDVEGSGGTLTFSLGLPLQPHDWSGLSLAVGLSVAQSLHADLQLKWPNDLWWQGRKLAGILIETATSGETRYAVIGVGINIAPQGGDGLRTPPAALQELMPDLDAPAVLRRVAAPLVHAVLRFSADGFAPLRAAYLSRDVLFGQQVLCTDGTQGTAAGVDATGTLLVHTAAGTVKINSAEVSVRPAAL